MVNVSSGFLATLKNQAAMIQNGREKTVADFDRDVKNGVPVSLNELSKAIQKESEEEKPGKIIARPCTLNKGDKGIEIIFPGAIDKQQSKELKDLLFGYSSHDQLWRARATDETVSYAIKICNENLIPSDYIKKVEPVAVVPTSETPDILTEYKEALRDLSECWNVDITEAMMRAVIKQAKEL